MRNLASCVPLSFAPGQGGGTRSQNSIPIILSRGCWSLVHLFLHGTFAVFWTRFPVSPTETLVQESMLTQVWVFLAILLLDVPLQGGDFGAALCRVSSYFIPGRRFLFLVISQSAV